MWYFCIVAGRSPTLVKVLPPFFFVLKKRVVSELPHVLTPVMFLQEVTLQTWHVVA
jgi:hypothetical protein